MKIMFIEIYDMRSKILNFWLCLSAINKAERDGIEKEELIKYKGILNLGYYTHKYNFYGGYLYLILYSAFTILKCI